MNIIKDKSASWGSPLWKGSFPEPSGQGTGPNWCFCVYSNQQSIGIGSEYSPFMEALGRVLEGAPFRELHYPI